jgi:hypothetical protein
LPLALLAILGVAISFLGSFFYYGGRGSATHEARQNTMEWITSDNVWNEVAFNARLFQVWWKGGSEPVLWTPSHIWVWEPPADVPPPKAIDLRKYSEPQSFILYYWSRNRTPVQETQLRFYLFCFGSGLLLLGGTLWSALGLRAAVGGSRLKALSKPKVALGLASIVLVAAAYVWMTRPVKPKLVLDKTEVVAGRGDYTLKIAEMPNENVMVRYSVNGAEPAEMKASLDSTGSVHFDVLAETPKGVYRMLAFKREQDLFWFDADVVITVK